VSLGGMTGMWLGVHAPARVDRLVLICTSAKLGPAAMWADRAQTVRDQGTAAVAEAGVGRWLTEGFRARHPDTAEWLRAMIAAQPDEGYASCCGVIEHMDQLADLPSMGAPTLVIAGAQDPATPPEHGQRIVDAVPGARLEVLDPGAHLVNAERPHEVTNLILEHL
jgi:3-oxoadipate enol-lactonase